MYFYMLLLVGPICARACGMRCCPTHVCVGWGGRGEAERTARERRHRHGAMGMGGQYGLVGAWRRSGRHATGSTHTRHIAAAPVAPSLLPSHPPTDCAPHPSPHPCCLGCGVAVHCAQAVLLALPPAAVRAKRVCRRRGGTGPQVCGLAAAPRQASSHLRRCARRRAHLQRLASRAVRAWPGAQRSVLAHARLWPTNQTNHKGAKSPCGGVAALLRQACIDSNHTYT